ncbi:MAG: carbohydrate kinase [Lachnospiraceae bacterium]|nr:carbohydrate kinase [Lachnospiraceae bacterium]
MKIAGLDIGTTGCKCTVFDEKGRYLERSYRDYPVSRRAGSHEIDASAVLDAVYEVIREMALSFPDIGGIGITSFGETFVLTDEKGSVLAPSMLYTDPRGREEREWLVSELGERKIAHIAGLKAHEMYCVPKLMWMKKNHPEIWQNVRYVFQMEDFIIYNLSGERVIDYSLATRTLAFDVRNLQYCDEILEKAGLDRELFSTPVPTGTIAGEVTASASERCGLKRGTKVVAVSQDQVAAAVGAGAFDPEVAVDGAGTVECLTPVYDRVPDIDEMMKGCFSVVPYVIPGHYVAYAFSYTGGALIQWCIDGFAKSGIIEAKGRGISVNRLIEERYEDKYGDAPSGLLVLPHIAGAATPHMDTGSKGVVAGLTADMGVTELYRGCMEGVAYEMYLNMEYLLSTGVRFRRLNATGGGAKSAVWIQMKADVLDLPITTLKTADAGTVGSAMLVGCAMGIFSDLDDAAAHMVDKERTFEPRPAMHERYMEIYGRYRRLYDAVRPLV